MNEGNIALASTRDLVTALRELAPGAPPAGLLPAVLVKTGLADGYCTLETPLGTIYVAYTSRGVAATGLTDVSHAEAFETSYTARFGRRLLYTPAPPPALVRAVSRRLRGQRGAVPLDTRGLSQFERATLSQAAKIPRGELRPYSWVARQIGRPGATRAVGSALGRNPIPLLIPCHRVVRGDGRIGQYVFGTPTKLAILRSEGVDTDQVEAAARTGVRYLGSATTGIFCFPTCRNARRISTSNQVAFKSAAAARASSFRPCAVCQP